jgi:Flp pilus assembly pilin Flp
VPGDLISDQRGVVTVEYALVLALVSVGASLALLGVGALLVQLFHFQQTLLLLPFP